MNPIVLIELLVGTGAWIWLIAELVMFLADRRAGRRRAPRVEAPRRMALAADDETDDEPTADLTPYVCPYCRRNAGHDDGCYVARVQRRTDEIQIPREGEIK